MRNTGVHQSVAILDEGPRRRRDDPRGGRKRIAGGAVGRIGDEHRHPSQGGGQSLQPRPVTTGDRPLQPRRCGLRHIGRKALTGKTG